MAELTAEQIKLINILDEFYKKADDAQLPLLFTTMDLFQRLQSIYPSPTYTPEDLYHVMIYQGYDHMISETATKMYWLIQEKL